MRKSGDRVGRYLVEALLGAGAMGEVYEARDTRLGRRVALKLMRKGAEPLANQRLLLEAHLAAAFEHPNAVVVYEAGEVEDEVFIAMELVRGRSLRAFVGAPIGGESDGAGSAEPASDGGATSGPASGRGGATSGVRAGPGRASLGRRLRWMVDAARALGAGHRAGLVHRDVKPDNLLVRDDGVVKVLDFGIARRAVAGAGGEGEELAKMAAVTGEGSIVGTPMYWAPEQLVGEDVDARTDQFAWGVTAYELLAGELPWDVSDSIALVSQILTSEPPVLGARVSGLAEEVERALLRAMSKQAGDRYATLDEAADAIEPFAEAPGVGVGRGAAAPRPAVEAERARADTGGVATTSSPLDGGRGGVVAGDAPGDDGGAARESAREAGVPGRAGRRRGRGWILVAVLAVVLVAVVAGVLGARARRRVEPPPRPPEGEPAALVVRGSEAGAGAEAEAGAGAGAGISRGNRWTAG